MPKLKKVNCNEVVNFAKETGLYKESNIINNYDIESYSSLTNCEDNSIVFIKNSSIRIDFSNLIGKNLLVISIESKELKNSRLNYIISDRPRDLYFQIINNYIIKNELIGISNYARVYTDKIGKDVYIGDNVYLCKEVSIGNNVKIYPNVSIICPCRIDDNTVIFSGTVIGADGFGMYRDIGGKYHQIPHIGGVQIGKNVVIGSNTCIDRGTIDDTIIENDVKIDNICHIGHNVCVGKNTLVVAGTILGGSCDIKANVYLAPGSIVINGAQISENALVGMGSVVINDVKENQIVVGVPARFLRENK